MWPVLLLALQVQAAPTPQARAEASVVLVVARLGEGSTCKQGSGVVVGPGLVATNAHVLQGAHHPVVRHGSASWPVTEVRTDPSHDLCLLTVPGLPLPAVEPGPDAPEVGQLVFSVGFPQGRGPVRIQGHLLGSWHYGESRLLQSDATTQHGSSGGGLFDAQGRLLGLTTFAFSEHSRLNLSIPTRWLQASALAAADPSSGQAHLDDLTSLDVMAQLAEDVRNWPAWEQSARAWATSNPEDPDAWMALGLALDKMARWEALDVQGHPLPRMLEAVQCFERSVSFRGASLRHQAEAWNALGAGLDTLNRFQEAEQAFLQAIRLDAHYAQAWLNLGASRLNASQLPGAAEALFKALTLKPDDGFAWARYAFVLQKSGALEEALRAYGIALRYRPLSDELWWELGALQVKLQKRSEAEGTLAKLQDRDSPFAGRLDALLRQPTKTMNRKKYRRY